MKYNTINSGANGIGHIIIPNNVDRDKFIATCFHTNKVSILIGMGGGIANQCPIDGDVLQRIEFPETSNTIGSDVAYITIKDYDQPVIIAKIPKLSESTGLNLYTFKVGKGDVRVSGNDDGKVLNIVVDSTEKGQINLITKASSSIINIKSLGEADLYGETQVNIKSNSNILLNARNASTDSNTTIELDKEGKIKFFEGGESIVLGDTLKSKLESILDGISAITVPTGLGASGTPLNTVTFTNIKSQLKSILSEKVSTD